MNEKLRAAVYGAIIGDALGVPFEFKKRGSFQCTGMKSGGTHGQPMGTWSDDGAMILATCKSLQEKDGKVVEKDLRRKFGEWMYNGEFATDRKVFDCGYTVRKALNTGESQTDERDNGNGSLMRILPLAFTDCSDEDVRLVSGITHGHEISMQACLIYVQIIRRCLQGEPLEDVIHSLDCAAPFDRLSHIDMLPEAEIQSSGYVVYTLEAALWCILTTDSFQECLLKAVNLGLDTDTTACVAGGLAAVSRYGFEDIPEEWFRAIRNKELIEDCLF